MQSDRYPHVLPPNKACNKHHLRPATACYEIGRMDTVVEAVDRLDLVYTTENVTRFLSRYRSPAERGLCVTRPVNSCGVLCLHSPDWYQ